MHLGFDFSYNHLGGRWRLPGGWETHAFLDMAMFDHIAHSAERACLALLFSGDGIGEPAKRVKIHTVTPELPLPAPPCV